MGGVVGHGVQRPGVVEHRWGDLVESVVDGADAEEVGHNVIDGSGLAEGTRNCRGVVASRYRFLSGRGVAYWSEDRLLEDQHCQFEVRVSDDDFWVGEADHLLGDVGWPLDASGVVHTVFVWVYPPPPPRCPGLKS